MKRTSLIASLSLTLMAATTAGCATDTIESDYLAVEAPNTPGFAPFIVSAAMEPAADGQEGSPLFLRIGNQLLGTTDGSAIELSPGSSFTGAIPPGDHVIQMENAAGDVLLRTSSESFAPEHLNQIVAYGDTEALSYKAFISSWDEAPAGKVRVSFLNGLIRKVPGTLSVCRRVDESTECDEGQPMEYGDSWSSDLSKNDFLRFDLIDPAISFSSSDFGEFDSTTLHFIPLDWENLDSTDCPGCTTAFDSSDGFFRL